jgi:hypothetical protein
MFINIPSHRKKFRKATQQNGYLQMALVPAESAFEFSYRE